jgi:hypothetical protein
MGNTPIPPVPAPAERIQPAGNIVNQGGQVIPVYGVRRPAMYHLMETEMMSISGFNAEALSCFAIGSFFLAAVLSVVIGAAFADSPLTEVGSFMLHRATWGLGVVAAVCYATGFDCLRRRKTMTDQIKRETKSEG